MSTAGGVGGGGGGVGDGVAAYVSAADGVGVDGRLAASVSTAGGVGGGGGDVDDGLAAYVSAADGVGVDGRLAASVSTAGGVGGGGDDVDDGLAAYVSAADGVGCGANVVDGHDSLHGRIGFSCFYRLVGLVVKASTSRAVGKGFDSRLRRGSSHTSDFRIGTLVATLPGGLH